VSPTPAAKAPVNTPHTSAAAPSSSTYDVAGPCGVIRDIIVRFVTPDLPPSAEELGNYTIATCEPTFQSLEETSPKEPGYCTQAAWASDNPGYDAEASPAAPLKNVQVAYGPACG
jgi:hypothetical protein